MVMSRAWYVTCDGCGAVAPVCVMSARDARDAAREDGFRRIRTPEGPLDLCQNCQPTRSSSQGETRV